MRLPRLASPPGLVLMLLHPAVHDELGSDPIERAYRRARPLLMGQDAYDLVVEAAIGAVAYAAAAMRLAARACRVEP